MNMQLPYRFTDIIKDEALSPEVTTTDSLELITSLEKRHAEAILVQLRQDLTGYPEYVAACLITGRAHGYEMQNLLLQLQDGGFIHRQWSDLSSIEETADYIQGVELNLAMELQALRESRFILRELGSVDNDIGGLPGRYIRVFLSTNEDGEWLSCPSPLLGNDYEGNTITRICRALGWRIILK